MAVWLMTLNGVPATDANGTPIPAFNDGTGLWPGNPNFKEAERIAALHLAGLADFADGMSVQSEQPNRFDRISGTHTYSA